MSDQQFWEVVTQDCGKAIKGYSNYGVLENGTIRNNWNGHNLKPDKYGCVCIKPRKGKAKTFSIARLVAIHWLEMPDDPEHMAYKKDPNGGFDVSNIAWDTKHNVLSIVHKRAKKHEEWKGVETID